MLDDDELYELLGDEDKVREALLAAVEREPVPPVHTDLVEIVERGKRRARMQVLAASVGAVVLIAAVALGATALGRSSGTDVSTASTGPSQSLTVTTAANSTTPAPVATGVCLLPMGELTETPSAGKPTTPAQAQEAEFIQLVQQDYLSSAMRIDQVIPPLADHDVYAAAQIEGSSGAGNGTVVFRRAIFGGDSAGAAAADIKFMENLSAKVQGESCSGTINRQTLPGGLLLVYSQATDDQALAYQRVVYYTNAGQQIQLTSIVSTQKAAYRSAPGVTSSAGGPAVPTNSANSPALPAATSLPLSAAQLTAIAVQLGEMSG